MDEFYQPVENAVITITAQSAADGSFSIPNAPTWQGFIRARATALVNNKKLAGSSGTVTPVIQGTTYLGDSVVIQLGKVAFYSSRDVSNEIYVMEGDGANQTRLTTNTLSDSAPYFSPDGSKILYLQRDFCSGWLIKLMDSDGSNPVNLGTWIQYNVYDATAWSADSRKLVFGATDGLYVINSDGTNKRRIAAVNSDYASWARNAEKIVFLHYSGSSRSDLYAIDPDGTNLLKLSNTPTFWKYYISMSPDGSKVAYVQDEGSSPGVENIYVVNTDGTNPQKITGNLPASYYWGFAWSPDSNHLAAIRSDDVSRDESVVVLNADNAALPVEINRRTADSPTWSPDGSQIMYGENGSFYTASSDGTNRQLLISGSNLSPNWSAAKDAVADPGTTISGRILDEVNQSVAGAKVLLFDEQVATTGADGSFSAEDVPTLKGALRITATSNIDGKTKSGFAAAPVAPVAGGTTVLGDVRVTEKMVSSAPATGVRKFT